MSILGNCCKCGLPLHTECSRFVRVPLDIGSALYCAPCAEVNSIVSKITEHDERDAVGAVPYGAIGDFFVPVQMREAIRKALDRVERPPDDKLIGADALGKERDDGKCMWKYGGRVLEREIEKRERATKELSASISKDMIRRVGQVWFDGKPIRECLGINAEALAKAQPELTDKDLGDGLTKVKLPKAGDQCPLCDCVQGITQVNSDTVQCANCSRHWTRHVRDITRKPIDRLEIDPAHIDSLKGAALTMDDITNLDALVKGPPVVVQKIEGLNAKQARKVLDEPTMVRREARRHGFDRLPNVSYVAGIPCVIVDGPADDACYLVNLDALRTQFEVTIGSLAFAQVKQP